MHFKVGDEIRILDTASNEMIFTVMSSSIGGGVHPVLSGTPANYFTTLSVEPNPQDFSFDHSQSNDPTYGTVYGERVSFCWRRRIDNDSKIVLEINNLVDTRGIVS